MRSTRYFADGFVKNLFGPGMRPIYLRFDRQLSTLRYFFVRKDSSDLPTGKLRGFFVSALFVLNKSAKKLSVEAFVPFRRLGPNIGVILFIGHGWAPLSAITVA